MRPASPTSALRRRRRAATPAQGDLFRRGRGTGRGGWRAGAGRKRSGTAGVWHVARPALSRHHPVHVTLRVRRDAPNLRRNRLFAALREVFRKAQKDSFRLCHFVVMGNHVHLICEADDATALSRGVQGLAIRFARRVNRELGRRGKLLGDRYHARQLTTPREVRNALNYVLNNRRRHAEERGERLAPDFVDAWTSAPWFDGWRDYPRRGPRLAAADAPVVPPRAWLLTTGWKRDGLLSVREVPAAAPAN
jgi:REP element-mobilizing transposase RayT